MPVAMVTWVCGRHWGYVYALISTAAWAATIDTAHGYTHPAYFYWDGAVLGVMLLLFASS
jgi:hypothetical protein